MAAKRPKRDSRYTRTVGSKPHIGRRFVENGKVRIQWTEDGKRRSRTIGTNSAATRHRADEELEAILSRLRASAGETAAPHEQEEPSLEEALRASAGSLMDAADHLVDWIEGQLRKGFG